ncbi:hypothetical protein [Mucilaginibacter sp.]|uniref:hypothetical protein n=1 Tax=Mucilaginibacter sp. TaxID=1882438 RepID=UPI002631E59D|nr:hypothetical protein [Mucilaginibacter sp.]MDB5030532.1 hypothetical protein [Mucilaginibacter sp.]
MNNIQLFINDQLVDLSDDSPIALTFQINNLAEVQNQQGNTSNQFKLPLTQRNRRILGFPDDVAFCTGLPYTQYDAKLMQDGLEIIPYGIGELNSIDQDSASITILSGNVDFFDAIDGKLYDMGDSTSQWSNYVKSLVWKPYDHAWTLDNVAHSQTKTDGWIYPVIDYGNFSENFTDPININFLRPGFFIKTAIELLVKSAGYKATGSLLADPLYPLLIAQFSNGTWEHGTDYQNSTDADPLAIQVKTSSDMNYGNVDQFAGTIPFHTISSGQPTLWNVPDQSYRAPASVSATIELLFSVAVTGDAKKHNKAGQTIGIEIRLKKYNSTGNELLTSTIIDLSNNPQPIGGGLSQNVANNVKLSVDIDLVEDEHIYVEYNINNNKSGGLVTLKAGSTLTITTKRQKILYGQQIQCERIFPDISQKDLLKDTLQRFGITCQTDNASKTISFNSFHDIVNNIPVAKNWTKKCLDQGKTINFQLGGYAQINNLKYKADDAVLPAGFADAVINVADTTLSATPANLFESQFAPTLNRPYIGGTVAQIKMIDGNSGGTDFSIGVSPRILIDQKLNINALGKTVTFTDGNGNNIVVNDYISTPYFYKPDAQQLPGYGPASLKFDYLRIKYYPELEKILKQTKKVIRYFLLTPRDILELDLLIPIYLEQDSAYYYINKIDAWRKGQPVKVELVKLE